MHYACELALLFLQYCTATKPAHAEVIVMLAMVGTTVLKLGVIFHLPVSVYIGHGTLRFSNWWAAVLESISDKCQGGANGSTKMIAV